MPPTETDHSEETMEMVTEGLEAITVMVVIQDIMEDQEDQDHIQATLMTNRPVMSATIKSMASTIMSKSKLVLCGVRANLSASLLDQ